MNVIFLWGVVKSFVPRHVIQISYLLVIVVYFSLYCPVKPEAQLQCL